LSQPYDLQYDIYTLPFALCLLSLWLCSVRLCFRSGRRGWEGIITSFIGFTWVTFGLHFLLRFAFLSWDSETYQRTHVPMWSIEPSTINSALAVAGLYWVFLCAGYAIGVRGRGPGLLAPVSRLDATWDPRAGDTVAVIAGLSLFFFGAQHVEVPVPRWLLTPLGLIGALWPIPASIAWGAWHRPGEDRSRWGARRWFYMLPGFVMVAVLPYRERMLQFLLVPLVAAISAGRRISLGRVFVFATVILLLSTAGMSSYRKILWEQMTVTEATENLDPEMWETGAEKAPWVDIVRRFHGFDSLTLTLAYVPQVYPFEGRNFLFDILIQLIPRAIYPEKPLWERSAEFSIKIWGYGLPEERLGTKIAPSMAGDLYSSGGYLAVVMGAMFWGLVIGALEGWKDRLPPIPATMVLAFLFTAFLGAIERDVVLVVASTVQLLVVFLVVTVLITHGAAMVQPK